MSLTYVAVASRDGRSGDALLQTVEESLPRSPQATFAWSLGGWAARVYEYDRVVWHPTVLKTAQELSAVSGYLLANGAAETRPPVGSEISTAWRAFDGEWSALACDATGVAATSSAAGTEHVYLDRNASYVALSNRCRPLWHLRALHGLELRPDFSTIARLLHLTYPFCTHRTAVEGIELLSPGETVRLLRDGEIARTQPELRFRYERADVDFGSHEVAAKRRITEVCGAPARLRVAVTGGKDSRLVVAMLDAVGGAEKADGYIRTPESHSDFVVGRRIAGLVGMPYTRYEPDARDALAASLQRHLRFTEGMLSAWDMKDATPTGGELSVHGLLGEVYRRKPDSGSLSAEGLARRFLDRPSASHVVRGEVRAEHVRAVREWITSLENEGVPLEYVPDLLYLRQRVPRWVGQAKLHDGLWGAHVNPVFALRLLTDYYSLPLADRVEERVHFELTARLSPRLAKEPFANARFSPKMVARSGLSVEAATEAVRSEAPQEHLLWRKSALRTSMPWVREQLAAASHSLRDLVDPARVRDLAAAAALAVQATSPSDVLRVGRAPRLAVTALSNPTHLIMDVFSLLTAARLMEELGSLRSVVRRPPPVSPVAPGEGC